MNNYDLFLEDGDLLEMVNIENTISGRGVYEDFLDKYISESEMMIDIYETQRFMIEQDTEIFMTLGYNTEYIEEGVLSKVWDAILNILRKIRDTVMKFINFIRGKRNSESKEESKEFKEFKQNPDKHVEKAEDDLVEAGKGIKLIEQKIRKNPDKPIARGPIALIGMKDDEEEKPTNNTDVDSKSVEDKNNSLLEELKEQLEKLMNEKKYIPIRLSSPDIVKRFNVSKDMTKVPEIMTLTDSIHELIDVLRTPEKLAKFSGITNREELYKAFKSNGLSNAAEVYKPLDFTRDDYDKYTNAYQLRKKAGSGGYGFIINNDYEGGEKVTREEYFKTYYPALREAFLGYSDKSQKYIDRLMDGLNNQLRPIEKEVMEIEKKLGDSEQEQHTKMIISAISRQIQTLSEVYIARINELKSFEHAFQVFENNLKMGMKDTIKIDKLNKRIKMLSK